MKILFLTHRLPYAPNRGDRIRAYHMLRHLARSSEIHLFSLATGEERAHTGELESWLTSVTTATPHTVVQYVRGAACLAGDRPLTHVLLDAPAATEQLAQLATRISPDLVFAYCSGMARFVVEGPLERWPSVVDMVDVDSVKWARLGERHRGPLQYIYRREARVLSTFEAAAARHAAMTLVVNGREREELLSLAPAARVEVIENGIDTAYFAPAAPPSESLEIVFCGVMNYAPNVEGACWFVANVWPLIRTEFRGARLTLVGSHPARAIRALANAKGVHVTGAVPDVRPYLWRAAVGIAPLLTARGIQNKILEALAAGLPVVTTPTAASGLPPRVTAACSVAETPSEFASRVIDFLRLGPMERRRCAQAARVDAFSWETQLARLSPLLEQAALHTRVRVGP